MQQLFMEHMILNLKHKKISNNVKTSIGSGVARIDVFGIKEDVEYEVEISSKILSYTPFKVVRENDSSLAPGKERVAQNGMNGCKSITYKILKLNGKKCLEQFCHLILMIQ